MYMNEKWKQEMMSYPKESLINLLAMYGQERERLGYCLMHLGHSKHGFEINEEHLKLVDSYVKGAIKEGAKLVYGGEKYTVPPCDKGSFYMPTILENVNNSMTCAQEEIFGPVLSVIKYKDIKG